MAIVSKAVFEKESPGAKVGDVLPLAMYRSAHKAFEKLDDKSRLFLVTVRPPDEKFWLVAVLEGLKFDGEKWLAKLNGAKVTDLAHLKSVLTFESGKGINAAKGQLGMSLQTPRVLTAADSNALLGAAGGAVKLTAPLAVAVHDKTNLTAHEDHPVLHCLCRRCLPAAPQTGSSGGMRFIRSSVENDGKVLHFWVPDELKEQMSSVTQSVKSALVARRQKRA